MHANEVIESRPSDPVEEAARAQRGAMADAAPVLIWETDASGVVCVNAYCLDFLGVSVGDVLGMGWTKFLHPDDAQSYLDVYLAAFDARLSYDRECRFRRADGQWRWLRSSGRAIADGRFVGCSYDVTDLQGTQETQQAQAALHTSKDNLKRLNAELERRVEEKTFLRSRTWEVNPDLLSVIDMATGTFDEVNPAWIATLGWSIANMQGVAYTDFVHPDDLGASHAAFEQVLRGEPVLRFTNRYRRQDGSYAWLQWVAVPENGKLYSSTRDVTAEREQALVLEQRTAERDRLWSNTQDIQVITDNEGRFQAVNPAFSNILGWSAQEVIGHTVFEFIVPEDEAITSSALTHVHETALPIIENRYRHREGGFRWISWVATSGGPLIYASGRHITAEKEQAEALRHAEDALRQSQKMEAVGQLTGGIAHDFNNLLTVIKSATELLKRANLAEERRNRYVGVIAETVDRAAKLTAQLLAFARRQSLKPEVFAACDSVRSLFRMMETLTGSRIEMVTQFPEHPCFVHADASQFDTALVNMAVNARDAMNGEGRLVIQVEAVTAIPALRAQAQVSGNFVAVSLTDIGSGIPTNQLDQIFEPFFTTKGVGHGTGLGLSQVFGFAKQSGGQVTVSSEVGQGSTFTLYLPRVAAPEHQKMADEPEPLMDGHGTCVLVVEDNIEVGTFAVQTLQDLGYVTVLANNAQEALAELAKDANRFDVVFSDVVMPGMSGIDLAHEIRRMHHDLPVVLTSGYSHVLSQNGTYGFELLHKPYSVEQLSRLLRKVATWQRRKRIMGK